MRAAGITEPSGPVRLLDLPRPAAPQPDEVLIDVRAAGVGNWDDLMRTGAWASGLDVPHALGVEAAGVIAEAGAAVTGFSAGDAVMTYVFPFRGGACWAEQMLAPAAFVASRPAQLDRTAAGALPVPALTAYQALHDVLRIRAGERVLVHGAGGVTGSLVVGLALLAGAEVVATAGPNSIRRLADHGHVQLVDRTRDGWQADLRRALSPGADAAVNAAPGGSEFATSMVRDGGRLVSITDAPPASARGIQTHYHVVRPDAAQLTMLGAMADDGELRLPAVRTFPLDRAEEALREVKRGAGGASIVLLP